MTNTLYYGDNLHVLREHIANESVDLVYLDPPFNSNKYTGRKNARLQIITVAELFQNKRPDILWVDTSAQKKAKREDTRKQGKLL